MSTVSTIPAAAAVLAGYMTSVANSLPNLNSAGQPGAYLTMPVESIRSNYMLVGDFEGRWFDPETYTWAAVPGASRLRLEGYALLGTIRSYTGSADLPSRYADVFSMLNGLQELVVSDPGGYGNGLTLQPPAVVGGTNLSPSGSWGDLEVTDATSGQINGQGWGVVMTFKLSVINAQITG